MRLIQNPAIGDVDMILPELEKWNDRLRFGDFGLFGELGIIKEVRRKVLGNTGKVWMSVDDVGGCGITGFDVLKESAYAYVNFILSN